MENRDISRVDVFDRADRMYMFWLKDYDDPYTIQYNTMQYSTIQ